jgi:hypothetical protein
MAETWVYHRIVAEPRAWREAATRIVTAGHRLYGLWRSQIGRPRDEVQAIGLWPEGTTAIEAERVLTTGIAGLRATFSETMAPTLRPADAAPPHRQGNYAFRWFATPERHWGEFLELCAGAWPGFEAAYDSQVVGLWRMNGERSSAGVDEASGAGLHPGVRSLLLTRRPNLAMWERSKLPQGPEEAAVRAKLSRRYDLCDWTVVSTATLLTADDTPDTARWA